MTVLLTEKHVLCLNHESMTVLLTERHVLCLNHESMTVLLSQRLLTCCLCLNHVYDMTV